MMYLGGVPIKDRPDLTPFPFAVLSMHYDRVVANHGADALCISRLVGRGLSPSELCAILEDRPWCEMDDVVAFEHISNSMYLHRTEPAGYA